MVIKSVLFSLVLSFASIVLVFAIPIGLDSDRGKTYYSPYHEELLELESKGAWQPEEYQYLRELTEKNNQWHKELQKKILKEGHGRSAEEVAKELAVLWKKRNLYLSPIFMVLWGGMFYLFFKPLPHKTTIFVLSGPVILASTQLMPAITLLLIAIAVFAAWSWLYVRSSKNLST